MSSLQERRLVECPYHLARNYLAGDVAAKAETQQPGVWRLRAKLAGADLNKSVTVTFDAGTDPMHFDQPWKVHWTPVGGGPYPDFDGTLAVRADEEYRRSILELDGDYCPPGGAVGQAFDLAVGARIASETARSLLDEMATAMERRYAETERAKHAASPEVAG